MNIITTTEQLQEFVRAYANVEAFAFDVETIGENRGKPVLNDVCWISFANGSRVDVIPMGHPNGSFDYWEKPLLQAGRDRLAKGKELNESSFSKNQALWIPIFNSPPEQLTPAEVFSAIKPLMFGPALKIGHNVKFDAKSIAKYYGGNIPSKPYFDTLMASFITDNRNKNKLSLKVCVERELKVQMEKGIGEDVSKHSFEDVANYSGIDADLTWKLYETLKPRLEGNLLKVWQLEMDVLPALCDMELHGALIDQTELASLSERIAADKELAEAKAYKIAGKAFSLNSVQAKQELLFMPQEGNRPRVIPNPKIPSTLTEKGKQAYNQGQELNHTHYSTSSDALEFYREKDELVAAILEYQDLNKLLSTYVTPYTGGTIQRIVAGKKKEVFKPSLLINGRVHTQFNAHGAETGRLSSSEPNLQNIPSSGDYGKLVRNLFIAPEGHKLVVADYSQIEPRVIASFSGDPVMLETYHSGGDIYTAIGDTMGVDRKAGKVLVLAISYGVGPDKIASSIGCSVKEAKDLLKGFDEKFSDISRYKGKVVRLARQRLPLPFVETVFGRRRYIPELKSSDRGLLSRAERQAFNTVIQGSAADIMKLAIVRAHSCFINEPSVNVSLTVHDELVTVAPDHLVDEVVNAIALSMEGINLPEITVPLKAEVNVVQRWGEAK
jgi:DNA polymerase I-like protein with 3'-5' exonuclease and polymerase domains